jgi:RND superfamily putative drug exporter
MVLVPATMALLGRANWWLPSWLDRVLPELTVEGSPHHVDVDVVAEPALVTG